MMYVVGKQQTEDRKINVSLGSVQGTCLFCACVGVCLCPVKQTKYSVEFGAWLKRFRQTQRKSTVKSEFSSFVTSKLCLMCEEEPVNCGLELRCTNTNVCDV